MFGHLAWVRARFAVSRVLWQSSVPKSPERERSSRQQSSAPRRGQNNSDARVAEARIKVSKLEKALDALEGTSGEAIKKALVKATAAAHEKPLAELIDCRLQGFIDRAEKNW